MQGRKTTTSHIVSQLGGYENNDNKVGLSEHPYYKKFIEAGCDEQVFKEIVACKAVTNYEALYSGFTKSLSRFRESFDTLALMLCMSKDVDVIKYGIQNQLITVDLENCYGDTPLHLAALSGSASVVAWIIDAFNIDPMQTETGIKANALHYAAMSDDISTLEYLIKVAKMPLDSKNLLGHNALDYACTAGAVNAMDYLYQLGLRPNLNKISHLVNGAPEPDNVWKKLETLGAIKIENNTEKNEMDSKPRPCQIF